MVKTKQRFPYSFSFCILISAEGLKISINMSLYASAPNSIQDSSRSS